MPKNSKWFPPSISLGLKFLSKHLISPWTRTSTSRHCSHKRSRRTDSPCVCFYKSNKTLASLCRGHDHQSLSAGRTMTPSGGNHRRVYLLSASIGNSHNWPRSCCSSSGTNCCQAGSRLDWFQEKSGHAHCFHTGSTGSRKHCLRGGLQWWNLWRDSISFFVVSAKEKENRR